MTAPRCEACGQTLPPPKRPCARNDCGHDIAYHALNDTPPRTRHGCVVQESGIRCGCRQYVAVAS